MVEIYQCFLGIEGIIIMDRHAASQHHLKMKNPTVYHFDFSFLFFSILRRRLLSCRSFQDRLSESNIVGGF